MRERRRSPVEGLAACKDDSAPHRHADEPTASLGELETSLHRLTRDRVEAVDGRTHAKASTASPATPFVVLFVVTVALAPGETNDRRGAHRRAVVRRERGRRKPGSIRAEARRHVGTAPRGGVGIGAHIQHLHDVRHSVISSATTDPERALGRGRPVEADATEGHGRGAVLHHRSVLTGGAEHIDAVALDVGEALLLEATGDEDGMRSRVRGAHRVRPLASEGERGGGVRGVAFGGTVHVDCIEVAGRVMAASKYELRVGTRRKGELM
mmetsp:Transcript_1054/g.2264  ORF Transcript_1054/g.2264 Transcript_1054/m.2264 type:complete len:268 (+) Transcript_1054:1626-2429(+)